jgi:uncharacterized protein
MTVSGWRQSVIEYIRAEAQPADKFGHQPRLYELARQIGSGMDYDDDVIFAAAWMHDLGVFLGHRPSDPAELTRWDHVPYTIARSHELLPAWGFPASKLDMVAEVIRTHQPKDEPILLEAVILRDADMLEQLGAIGALRSLVKIGRDTRYLTFSDVLQLLESSVEHLPGKLRLVKSKVLARDRVDHMRALLAAIHTEAGALLY